MALTTSYSEETAVYEYSYTAGTGSYQLAGAWSTHLPLSARYPSGATALPYYVKDGSSGNGSQFEINVGNYDAGAKTLTRGTPLASSNNGALVNWSGRTRLLIRPLLPVAAASSGGGGGSGGSTSFMCCAVSDAVYFDGLGTSVYRTLLDGVADSPHLTVSYWISQFDGEALDQTLNQWGALYQDPSNPGYFYSQNFAGVDDSIYFAEASPGANQVLAFGVDVDGSGGAWINILISIDASQNPPVVTIFQNEIETDHLNVSAGPFVIPFSQFGLVIGDAQPPVRVPITGSPPVEAHLGSVRCRMGAFWYAPGVLLDFTNPANRAKFHDLSTGAPVDLGTNGETPTGTPPAVFLNGPKGQFPTNMGTGGAFAVTRVLEDSLIGGPSNFLPPPARTRGAVRWAGSGTMAANDSFGPFASSPTFAFSFWLRMAVPQTTTVIIYGATLNAGSDPAILINLDPSGFLGITLGHLTGVAPAGIADRERVYTQTSQAIRADYVWHHVAISGDTAALTFQIYIDRIAATTTFSDTVGTGPFTIAYSETTDHLYWWWFGPGGTSGGYVGDSAEFWGDLANKIDFSASVNLDKFCSTSILSVDLGTDGSLPTGTAPSYYFSQSPIGYEAITFMSNRARSVTFPRADVMSPLLELYDLGFGDLSFIMVAPAPYTSTGGLSAVPAIWAPSMSLPGPSQGGRLPSAGEVLFDIVLAYAAHLPDGLTGSVGTATIAATSTAVFTLQKNGSSIGTATFAASGTTATFSFASAVDFAVGDHFDLIAPSPQDATLAGISFTFSGTR